MKLNILFAAVVALGATAASAATFTHDFGAIAAGATETLVNTDSFAGAATIQYTFSLSTAGAAYGSYWTEPVFAGLNESHIPQFTLAYNGTSGGKAQLNGSAAAITYYGDNNFGFTGLSAGNYTVSFSSFTDPYSKVGKFGSTLTVVSSVPEPETYAMMLAGLGIVGFIARRRKSV